MKTTTPRLAEVPADEGEGNGWAMLRSMPSDQSHLIEETNAEHTVDLYTEEDFPAYIWKADASALSFTELKRKYPLTFNSYQNTIYGRGRGPNGEVKHYITPEVRDLNGFLLHFGPRQRADLTLDRLDCSNPYYGPGLCQWRDKKEQGRNRRTTIIVEHPDTGASTPLVQLAEEWNVSQQRVRRWHRNGLSPREMQLAASGAKPKVGTSVAGWPWPLDQRRLTYWEHHYDRLRQPASEWGYELRSEFAVRWLTELIQKEVEWLTSTWEQNVDPDPRIGNGIDDLSAELREEFEGRLALKSHLEQRLADAREAAHSIAAWAKRDRVPNHRSDAC